MDRTQIKTVDAIYDSESWEHISEDLKQEINNLLWRFLPKQTTLESAERIAIRWFDAIEAMYKSIPHEE